MREIKINNKINLSYFIWGISKSKIMPIFDFGNKYKTIFWKKVWIQTLIIIHCFNKTPFMHDLWLINDSCLLVSNILHNVYLCFSSSNWYNTRFHRKGNWQCNNISLFLTIKLWKHISCTCTHCQHINMQIF